MRPAFLRNFTTLVKIEFQILSTYCSNNKERFSLIGDPGCYLPEKEKKNYIATHFFMNIVK